MDIKQAQQIVDEAKAVQASASDAIHELTKQIDRLDAERMKLMQDARNASVREREALQWLLDNKPA